MSPFVVPGLGFLSTVSMKHETIYGTAVTGTTDALSEIMSAEINPRLSVITDPSLTSVSRSPRFIGQGGQYYEWSVKVRAGYNGMLPWIRMMFPGYTGVAMSAPNAAAIDHTFKEIGTGPAFGLWPYTIEISWGGVPANTVTRLAGALATGLRFSCQAGTGENAMLICEVSGVCKSVTPGVAPGLTAGSLPTALGVIYHQQSQVAGEFGDGTGVAATAIQMKSMEVNITQPFDMQRFLLAQVNAESPVPNGLMDCTFNMELEWASAAQFVSMLNGGGATIRYLFRGTTLIAGTTTAFPEFEIIAHQPTAAEYGTAIPGYGVVTQRLSHKAAYSATDLTAVIIHVKSIQLAMGF